MVGLRTNSSKKTSRLWVVAVFIRDSWVRIWSGIQCLVALQVGFARYPWKSWKSCKPLTSIKATKQTCSINEPGESGSDITMEKSLEEKSSSLKFGIWDFIMTYIPTTPKELCFDWKFGLVLGGGLTFKNRDHSGSRYSYISDKSLWLETASLNSSHSSRANYPPRNKGNPWKLMVGRRLPFLLGPAIFFWGAFA